MGQVAEKGMKLIQPHHNTVDILHSISTALLSWKFKDMASRGQKAHNHCQRF